MFTSKKKRIEELEARLHACDCEVYRLNALLAKTGAGEANELEKMTVSLRQQLAAMQHEYAGLGQAILAQRANLDQVSAQLAGTVQQLSELNALYDDTVQLAEQGLNAYTHPAYSSMMLGHQLERVRWDIKQMVRDNAATSATNKFNFDNSRTKGKKFVADMSTMMLRAYNAEVENCIRKARPGNGEAARKRIERCRNQVAKLGAMIDLEITSRYHALRLQELDLAVQHQNAVKAEKEEARERRAQLREDRKAQQELERMRQKLVKERAHYHNVLAKLQEAGKEDEAKDITDKLAEIDSEIEGVDFRAANQSAGYVYVISNLGSFGENMVKIGMTRRLDPMDRVRELSDASVPFNFDVHALFFTDNAVAVEAELHRRFADRRVNLINKRREFFEVSPSEVKDVLAEISGNLLEFVVEPEAEQYRQSLALRAPVHDGQAVPTGQEPNYPLGQ